MERPSLKEKLLEGQTTDSIKHQNHRSGEEKVDTTKRISS